MLVVFEQKRIKYGAVWSTPGHALSLAGYNRRRHCLWVLVGAIKISCHVFMEVFSQLSFVFEGN